MIEKEKVLKILQDFYEVQNEKAHKERPENLIGNLKRSDKEIELNNYISALPYDETIDLCALTDYGRECEHTGDKKARPDMFRQMRKSFFENHQNDEHLANYLLSIIHLNTYLRYALNLYDGLGGF